MHTDTPDMSSDGPTVAAPEHSGASRRWLVGAGLAGLVGALLPGRVGASSNPPRRPDEDDIALLAVAQSFELANVALYDLALSGGALDDATRPVYAAFREAHEAYAQSLSATLGGDAPGEVLAEVVDTYRAAFSGGDAMALHTAALELEQTGEATHAELVGLLSGTEGAQLCAAICVVEARHAVVLADLTGTSDLDAFLDNPIPALTVQEG